MKNRLRAPYFVHGTKAGESVPLFGPAELRMTRMHLVSHAPSVDEGLVLSKTDSRFRLLADNHPHEFEPNDEPPGTVDVSAPGLERDATSDAVRVLGRAPFAEGDEVASDEASHLHIGRT